MAFNSNFTAATLGANPNGDGNALIVTGTSDRPDAVTAISVLLCHGETLLAAAADDPKAGVWHAAFPEAAAAKPFEPGGDAVVVGVALLAGGRPLIWEGILQITA
jgi:hypothetical protein